MKKMLLALSSVAVIPAAVLFIPFAASGQPQLTGPAAEGQRKAMPCMSCHASNGNTRQGEHPKLAGQNMRYLVLAMQAYREGRRDSAIMKSFMADLSDRDIEDIAAFYSIQKQK